MKTFTDFIDFEGLSKRARQIEIQEKIPDVFWQCAIFYSTPIEDNVELTKLAKIFTKKGELQKYFVFPFYSSEIFVSQQDAQIYASIFIKELIDDKKIPENVFDADHKLKEEICKPCIVPLKVSFIEKSHLEELGFNN